MLTNQCVFSCDAKVKQREREGGGGGEWQAGREVKGVQKTRVIVLLRDGKQYRDV